MTDWSPRGCPPAKCWPCVCGTHRFPPEPHPDTTGVLLDGKPFESEINCSCDCAKETR